MSALEQLDKWCRKHYRFKIESGGHMQPGDGVCVTLSGGGRSVCVDESEHDWDEEKEDYKEISTEWLIAEALRQWHSGTSEKHTP
jgi:hypothetical protein